MINQLDSDEKGDSGERSRLLKNFRGLLARYWDDKDSMETLLCDAELNTVQFIFDASNSTNRWNKALTRMNSHQLLSLIGQVRESGYGPAEAFEELATFEQARLAEENKRLEAAAFEALAGLSGNVEAITESLKKFRVPTHLSAGALGILKAQLGKIYESLDNLRELQVHQPKIIRDDEIAQADNIEKQANACIDALQLYQTLLDLSEPDEIAEIGVTSAAGGSAEQADVARTLVRTKAALRRSLIRLAKAHQST